MNTLLSINWHEMFVPAESLIDMVIRGTIMYVTMFLLLRVFRRQTGSVGIADLLLLVVIADAAQNGMAGNSKSVTEAIVLILTIIFWNYFFNWLGFNSKFFEKLLEPKPLLVIEEGKLLRKNMKQELITYDEIMTQLRVQGIERVEEVKSGYLEPDGNFSFIKN